MNGLIAWHSLNSCQCNKLKSLCNFFARRKGGKRNQIQIVMSSLSSFFQDFWHYIEEQCDEARNNWLETKEILRFFLWGENEMIVILDRKGEKYDISEGGKMVNNYHIKRGMNKLRRKYREKSIKSNQNYKKED